MKKIHYYLRTLVLSLLSITSLKSHSQTKALTIGDRVPEVLITEIYNYKEPAAKLSDYKGRLLILDFWATWCSPCIAMLPKTDSLAKQFDGQIEILPVSDQDKKTVAAFLGKLNTIKHIDIGSVINDRTLNALFVHSSIPYYVWIDKNGELIATTESKEVNATNIQKVLDGQTFGIKNTLGTANKTVDLNKPIFVSGIAFQQNPNNDISTLEPIDENQILAQSTLTKYVPGVASKMSWDSTHFVAMNGAVINFYRLYYGLVYNSNPFLFWSKSRCLVELKDPVLYDKINSTSSGSVYIEWLKTNGYNYELVWKNARDWNEKRAMLGEDLERYFGKPLKISAAIEKRTAPSDVLTVIDQSKIPLTSGGASFEKHDALSYVQHNMPLSHFIYQLQSYFWQLSDRAVFDETQLSRNIDLELNCNMNNFDSVNKELTKFGLKFIEADRMTDVLVIKDK